MRRAALLLLLAAPAAAQALDDAPERHRRDYLVPALEAGLVDFGLASFNNLVTRQDWAQVSGATMVANLSPSAWTFDVDYLFTNMFGHAVMGAASMSAARSAGLGFWPSALYPLLASLAWELFFEREAPSINDQIVTPLAGALVGEALYRLTTLIWDLRPAWLSRTVAGLLTPAAALNEWMFDGALRPGDVSAAPPFEARVTAGLSTNLPSGVAAHLAGRLVYGLPVGRHGRHDVPFSWFDARAALTAGATPVTGDLVVQGLLVGADAASPAAHGLVGLFGVYDYLARGGPQVSSVSVGPGATGVAQLGGLRLRGTAVVSGIAFAGIGQVAPETNAGRPYHIGPGVHGGLDLDLEHPRFGLVSVRLHQWLVFGQAYAPPTGTESLTAVSAAALARIGPGLAAGLEADLAFRRARLAGVPDVDQQRVQLRVVVSYLFGPEAAGWRN